MKKYKFAKDDVLSKSVLIASGKIKNYDAKLVLSLLASKGILLYGKDVLPDDVYINLSLVTSAALMAEIVFDITDYLKRSKEKQKLLNLIDKLNENGYEISDENIPQVFYISDGLSSLYFPDKVKIDYYDGEYYYYDFEKIEKDFHEKKFDEMIENIKGQNISEYVYGEILSKKKYKKYLKSKQNK